MVSAHTTPSAPPPTIDVAGTAKVTVPPATQMPYVIVNVPAPEPVAKDGVADILNSVAAVLWPLVVAIALVLFRSQIVSLAKRIRKGKAFGAEAEFDEELEALNREAVKASEETLSATSVPASESQAVEHTPQDKVRSEVLAEAARSPRMGLMLLSADIDRLARRIAAASGHHQRSTVRDQLQLWAAVLPPHVSSAFLLFSRVRNRIVHGASASEQEILSAIDSGLLLYSALASIPIEQNIVTHTDIEIFGDEAATLPLEGKGVMMKTLYEGRETFRIFPTTQTHFRPGMKLSWDWNMAHVWGEAWYRDPTTNEIKKAWGGSAEFVGRDLDQI